MIWRCRHLQFDLSARVLVMGILNATPDSFSDGGRWLDAGAAVERALEMEAAGADIIDVGGESTRPGAESVEAAEETRRVVPIIKGLRARSKIAISIDTMKGDVAQAALDAGAEIVNDVTALRWDKRMARIAGAAGAGVALMHMQGEPRTMQKDPAYGDVVAEVSAFLLEREAHAIERGVGRDQIAFDPGFGFGKTFEHNTELFRGLEKIAGLGRPLLVGLSRKSFLRKIVGLEGPPSGEDVHRALVIPNAAVCAAAVMRGASILRVHDVAEAATVAKVAAAMR